MTGLLRLLLREMIDPFVIPLAFIVEALGFFICLLAGFFAIARNSVLFA
jgi:hypothetical protein